MEFNKLLLVLGRRLWIILLVTLVVSAFVSFTQKKEKTIEYKAKSTIYATNNEENRLKIQALELLNNPCTTLAPKENIDQRKTLIYEDVILGRQLMSDFDTLIRNKQVILDALKEINTPNITEEMLSNMIELEYSKDSNVIIVNTVFKDPTLSAKANVAICKAFIKKVFEFSKFNLYLLEEASVPKSPIKYDNSKRFISGIFIGLFLSLLVVFILEVRDNKIRTVEDLEKMMNLKVFGVVPHYKIKA